MKSRSDCRARARLAAMVVTLAVGSAGGCRSEANGGVRGTQEQGGDPALTAMADTLLPRLERISRLEALEPVVVERRSRAQVREFVERQLEERLPPDELEGVRLTYTMLGLIPDSLDLRALLHELYAEQIVGYYDPDDRKLFVVEGVAPETVRPVLAHELVHALQDQHTNLDSLIARERGNDRQLAAQAAIEGHAMLVMFSLLAEEATGRPVDPVMLPNLGDQLGAALEAPSSEYPIFRSAPRVIREALLFPYVDGASFVQQLWRSQGEANRTAPLDSLIPQSTEQVLDPEARFILERDEPTDLRFDDDHAGWSVAYENGLGQLEMGLFLEEQLGAEARGAAEGWDGDRFRLLRSAEGVYALVWYSIWDDDASAERFRARSSEVLDGPLGREGVAERISIDGRPGVRVVMARSALPANMPWPGVRVVEDGG